MSTTTSLTPTIPDAGAFISAVLAVPQDQAISIQVYQEVVFTVEGSLDQLTFVPIVNLGIPGIYKLDPGALVIRLRADVAGIAPYALVMSPP